MKNHLKIFIICLVLLTAVSMVSASDTDDINATDTLNAVEEVVTDETIQEDIKTQVDENTVGESAPEILGASSDEEILSDVQPTLTISTNYSEYDSIYVGDAVTIRFELDQYPELGLVTANIAGKNYNIAMINGKGNISFDRFEEGDYTVTGKFNAISGFTDSDLAECTFWVYKKYVNPSIGFDEPWGYEYLEGSSVLMHISLDYDSKPINGTVIVRVNGNEAYRVYVVDGHYDLTIHNLKEDPNNLGYCYVEVEMYDDGEYCPGYTGSQYLTLKKEVSIGSYVAYYADELEYGEPVQIYFGIYSDDYENFNTSAIVLLNNVPYYSTFKEGVGEIIFYDLPVGEYKFNVSAYGYISEDVQTNSFKVTPKECSIFANIDGDGYYQEIPLSGDSGMIEFDLSSSGVDSTTINTTLLVKLNETEYYVAIVGGHGELSLIGLAEGIYNLDSSIVENSNYCGEDHSHLIVTMPGSNDDSDICIMINTYPFEEGSNIPDYTEDEFKSNVDSPLTLYIAVLDTEDYWNPKIADVDCVCSVNVGGKTYNVPVFDGIGTFTLYDLVGGTTTINASLVNKNGVQYLNSSNYKINVAKIQRQLYISYSSYSIPVFSANFEINVYNSDWDIDDEVEGVAIVYINENKYEVIVHEGVGPLTVDCLPCGDVEMTAMIPDDDRYEFSSASASFSTYKLIPNINIYLGTSEGYDYSYQRNYDITQNPVIYIEIEPYDDDALRYLNNVMDINVNGTIYPLSIINGKGNLTLYNLPFGEYEVNASYNEDDIFCSSKSDPKTFEIKRIPAQIDIAVDDKEYTIAEYEISNDTADLHVKVTCTNANSFNGTVCVDVNGTKHYVVCVDGIGNLTLANLKNGKYEITAQVSDTAIYDASSVSKNLTVSKTSVPASSKLTPEIIISSPSEANVGDTVEITVSSNGYNLTVWINDVKQLINEGVISYTVSYDGIHNILAKTTENETYYAGTNSTAFSAVKNNAIITISPISDVKVGNSVTANIDTITDGEITVKVNGETIVGEFTPQSEGTYTVTVESAETAKYTKGFNTTTFAVSKRDSSISIGASAVGDLCTVDINLAAGTGKVIVRINGTEYVVNASKTTFETRLSPGTYIVNASYLGDNVYSANESNTVSVTVEGKITPVILITVPENAKVGDNVEISVSSEGYNLTVWINDAEQVLNDGKIAYTVSAAGIYNVVAKTSENDTYYSAVNSTAFSAVKNSAVLVISDIADVKVGDTLTIGFTKVTDGDVTVKVNGETIVGEFTPQSEGTYTVTVESAETASYAKAFNTTTFTVSKRDSSISIGASAVGDLCTVDINLAAGTGKVLIRINGTEYAVNASKTTFETRLAPSTYIINATYLGDNEYSSNVSNTVSVTVNDKILPQITISAPENANLGDDVEITVSSNGYNLTVWINDVQQVLNNGIITYTVPAAGIYNIVAKTTENDTYYANVNSTAFTAVKNTPVLIISDIADAKVGDKITVEITKVTDGDVTVKVNGEIVNGEFTPQSEGTYTVTVESAETAKYIKGFNATTFAVSKRDSIISIGASAVGDLCTVTFDLSAGSGKVIIRINGTEYAVNASENTFETRLAPGNYIINASYLGDNVYSANESNTVSVTVNGKITPDILITVPENAKVGDNVEISVSSEGYNLTVWINDVEQILNEGKISYTVESEGVYSIVARTSENNTYYANVNSTAFSAVKNTPVLIISEISDSEVGDNINIEINKVTDGDVTVKVNGEIVDGEFTPQSEGTYTVTVESAETAVYAKGFNTTIFTVVKKDSSINISADIKNNKDATVKINLTEKATGNVIINVNGTEYSINASEDVFEISLTFPGTYRVNASYLGDATFKESLSETVEITVKEKANQIISVEIPQNITVGEEITINVTSTGDGEISLYINGEKQTVNANRVTYTPQTSGSYLVSVTASESEDYYSAENTTSFAAVNKETVKLTPVIVIEEISGVKIGDNVKINITTDSDGEIEITVNGEKCSEFAPESAGKYTVVVKTNETDRYYAGVNTTVFEVTKLPSEVSITVDGVKVNINVTDGTTGAVLLKVNQTDYYLELASSKAEIELSDISSGNYTLTAKYLGDEKYDVSTNTAGLEVPELIQSDVSVKVENGVMTVNLSDDAEGYVIADINGTEYYAPVEKGIATITLPQNMASGNYTADVTYSGDDKYKAASTGYSFEIAEADIETIASENMTRGYGSPYDYQAVFMDSNFTVLANTLVSFRIGDKTYNVTTDDEGVAQLAVGLAVGKYTVVSINPVTGAETQNTLEIVKRILENKDMTMDYTDGSRFTVKVIGDDGNIAPEGEIISITANGVSYVAVVGKNGYASLKLNLLPKTYKVISEYKGYKTTNKLVVKQILKPVKKTIKVKKSKKSFKIKATLKWSSGKGIKGKTITFKIKGKTLKAKTNSKGVATVKVKKSLMKKLKKGKTYTVVINYAVKIKYGDAYQTVSDKVKCKVKVK